MGWLVQRLPIAKLLSACIMCWGAVLACTAVSPPPPFATEPLSARQLTPAPLHWQASHNFASLMVVRFLLGWFEAAVQPSFLILTSMWYRVSLVARLCATRSPDLVVLLSLASRGQSKPRPSATGTPATAFSSESSLLCLVASSVRPRRGVEGAMPSAALTSLPLPHQNGWRPARVRRLVRRQPGHQELAGALHDARVRTSCSARSPSLRH